MYRKNNVPPDANALPAYLDQELSEIERAQNEPVFILQLAVSNVPPAKVRPGMVVEADGTNWNPGAGAGLYIYRGSAWVLIG